jgi:hypothetical protein
MQPGKAPIASVGSRDTCVVTAGDTVSAMGVAGSSLAAVRGLRTDQRALTIHSSRSHFVARLNSGVRPRVAAVRPFAPDSPQQPDRPRAPLRCVHAVISGVWPGKAPIASVRPRDTFVGTAGDTVSANEGCRVIGGRCSRAPERSAGPNHSFKPKPLRGSA